MRTVTTVLFMFFALSISSCLAQSNRPQLYGTFEKLDLKDLKDGLIIKKVTGNYEPYKGVDFDSYSYSKKDNNGYTTLNGSSLEGFGYSYSELNSIYILNKQYYKSGIIKRKSLISNIEGRVFLGKEYYFNKDGELENVIDHDLDWNFSFEDIIQYIIAKNGSIKQQEEHIDTEISKKEADDEGCRKYWEILFDTKRTTQKPTWEVLKIDAKTGEILSQIEFEGSRVFPSDFELALPTQKIIKEDKTSNKRY